MCFRSRDESPGHGGSNNGRPGASVPTRPPWQVPSTPVPPGFWPPPSSSLCTVRGGDPGTGRASLRATAGSLETKDRQGGAPQTTRMYRCRGFLSLSCVPRSFAESGRSALMLTRSQSALVLVLMGLCLLRHKPNNHTNSMKQEEKAVPGR